MYNHALLHNNGVVGAGGVRGGNDNEAINVITTRHISPPLNILRRNYLHENKLKVIKPYLKYNPLIK